MIRMVKLFFCFLLVCMSSNAWACPQEKKSTSHSQHNSSATEITKNRLLESLKQESNRFTFAGIHVMEETENGAIVIDVRESYKQNLADFLNHRGFENNIIIRSYSGAYQSGFPVGQITDPAELEKALSGNNGPKYEGLGYSVRGGSVYGSSPHLKNKDALSSSPALIQCPAGSSLASGGICLVD